MKKALIRCLAFACMVSLSAQAQDMPAPHRMPRTPVSSQTLVEARDPMPASRQVQGLAAIIDGEKLRIGDADIRLFGVVPPQLAASFGPQARTALDMLANGQNVSCQIRDRDRDGRLLATCHNASGSDMALDLLRHGLAVTARGSIAGTELASPYLAAEQVAQNQKIGLWSVSIPTAAAAIVTPPRSESAALPADIDTKKEEKIAPRSDKAPAPETQSSETQAKIAADIINQHAQTQTPTQAQTQIDDAAWAANDNVGFFERYQILIAGLLMLMTALSIVGALWVQKRRDRLDEIKAIAAALRGELMAARGVCFGRVKSINSESDDRAAIWPRIRATLYQAYVARLGLLGAELARQVASIYGQTSDYAALYNAASPSTDAPKRQALETLLKNIDEVLPKLAGIEQTGVIPTSFVAYRATRSRYDAPPAPPALKALMSPTTTVRQPLPMIEKKIEGAEKPVEENVAEGSEAAAVATTVAAVSTAPSAPAPLAPAPTATLTHTQATAVTTSATRAPALLWEAVRGFIQNHRNAIADPHAIHDPHSTDYAEIIEADMARYQYGENIENFDVSPKKKSG